jgi:hypothetical protein
VCPRHPHHARTPSSTTHHPSLTHYSLYGTLFAISLGLRSPSRDRFFSSTLPVVVLSHSLRRLHFLAAQHERERRTHAPLPARDRRLFASPHARRQPNTLSTLQPPSTFVILRQALSGRRLLSLIGLIHHHAFERPWTFIPSLRRRARLVLTIASFSHLSNPGRRT